MQENNLQRRLSLIIDLLHELKQTHTKLQDYSSGIEDNSGTFFQKLYNQNEIEIQNEVNRYKTNIEKIKQLNCEITLMINKWYEFSKNPVEINSLLFPLKFYIKKKKLNDYIKKTNNEILNITVENRFIKEQLTNWEHELELKAVQEIKQGNTYEIYNQLVKKKVELISHLKYLMPTVPGICPAAFSITDIDSETSRLSNILSN